MRIYFRHGLYRAEQNSSNQPVLTNSGVSGLTARVSNSPIIWSIADHDKNYTVSEYTPVLFASPQQLAVSTNSWLYVDLNPSTGRKTYGITYIEPVYGPTAPSAPVEDQHWFDTVNRTTKVYMVATKRWHNRVRLVFGQWDSLAFRPYGFGSSVGLVSTSGAKSGSIIYDAAGKALKDSLDRFLTTEDKMFSDAGSTHDFSLESNSTRATALENIPAFHVVKWSDFDTVQLAAYGDTTECAVAIALNDTTRGNPVELCVQGKIINDAWNWPTVNALLWINRAGELTPVDPYELESHEKRRVPVARVIDRNTILFDQGLGGIGEKGDNGDVVGLHNASDVTTGITRLSVAPVDPELPIAVGINDPILNGPRVPLEHNHPATEITVSPFGSFTGTQAQQALLHLSNVKLSTSGGTVSGNIASTVGATQQNHLTTLADVEAKIKAAELSIKRFDLSASTQPSLTQAFNALSTSDRTLIINDLVVVVYRDDVFLWAGGYGIVTASNDSQFIWIGKINFEAPKGDVVIKTFVGSYVIQTTEPEVEA